MARPSTTMTAPNAAVAKRLQGKTFDWRSAVFQILLLLSLLLSLAVLVVLVLDLVGPALGVFRERGMDFVRSGLSSLPERAGIWQGLIGSLIIAAIVTIVAFPLGIAAAVYLEEFAPDTRFTRFITVNIRNLAGVPAVVYGILGVTILVKAGRAFTGGPTLLTGGLIMAILVLPIVIITASEALRAVPYSIREAGYGVGATRWEVVRSHVLPAAAPGILTGTVLSLSRALGETAPLLLVGAITGFIAFGDQSVYEMLYSAFTSLPTIVFGWARQPSADFRDLTAAAIVVLLLITLTANAMAIILRNRYERKW